MGDAFVTLIYGGGVAAAMNRDMGFWRAIVWPYLAGMALAEWSLDRRPGGEA